MTRKRSFVLVLCVVALLFVMCCGVTSRDGLPPKSEKAKRRDAALDAKSGSSPVTEDVCIPTWFKKCK